MSGSAGAEEAEGAEEAVGAEGAEGAGEAEETIKVGTIPAVQPQNCKDCRFKVVETNGQNQRSAC